MGAVSVPAILWGTLVVLGVLAGVAILVAGVLALWFLGPSRSVFKADLRHRIEGKRRLRSGKRVRAFPYVVGLLLTHNGVQATLLYRQCHWLATHHARPFAELLHAFAKLVTHIDVSPHARLGPGLAFYHGIGAVIGKGCVAGARLTVCQGATVVGNGIGDDVFVGAGAVILGTARVGDRVDIGALSLVNRDVPSDCRAVGVPVRRFLPRPPRVASEEGVVPALDA